MSLPASLFDPHRVQLDADIGSKKRLLEALAELFSDEESEKNTIFEKLLERERLGSTGLGYGVALPHARIESLAQPRAAFIRLAEGIDFDSPDGDRVKLVVALLVPQEATDEHLQLLAGIATIVNQESLRQELSSAESPEVILQLLTGQ
jgi:PTS system nitrogen regulatory IIA component